jgi:class 3 adenylate cyclase
VRLRLYGCNVTANESTTVLTFGPGWDRQDRWSLRFLDPSVERAYLDSMSELGRQRQRIALSVGTPLWLVAAVLGPPLLGIPREPIAAAAIVNVAVQAVVFWLTRRPLPLRQIWAAAFIITAVSAMGIVIGLLPGGTFQFVGAAAFMLNGVTAIGLVRPASWVAAAIGVMHTILFATVLLTLGAVPLGLFQLFLLIGTMAVAYLGSRYIETAERRAFAQGLLIADLHRRVDRLFRQYLSPDVAQALVDDPTRAELGGEVVEVSVLFADLRGYTPFSERTEPTEVVAMLNEYFGAAVPAVFAEGGTIVQFMGDALMAIFNAPIRQPDHALRACRSALALQHALADVSHGSDRPRFRVGINTGPALVGNVGSAELRNFSALGDTTNVAARLQTYAGEGSVVIGERTRELVGEAAEVRSLGRANLKGKSTPTPVFELISLREVSQSEV